MAEADLVSTADLPALDSDRNDLQPPEFQIFPSNIDHELLVEAESFASEKLISCTGSCTIKSSLHENEDRWSESTHDNFHIFTVTDGHDGADASDYASNHLSWNVLRCLESADQALGNMSKQYTIDNALRQAFLSTDAQFCQTARRTGSTSGSCVAALAIRGRHAAFASSGDCGLVFHDENGRSDLMCKRHTAKDPSEAERVRSVGGFIQGNRVMGILSPSRGFGDTDVRDSCPGSIIPDPDIRSAIISSSEAGISCPVFILIASDGVFDTVDLETAVSMVKRTLILHANQSKRAEMAAKKLVRYCADRTTDDITAVVICFR